MTTYKNGFTLIEILLVVIIIGVIAAIAIPNFNNLSNRNNTAKAQADIRALQVAVENFYLYNSSAYPAALSSLTTTTPVLLRTIPKDPYSSSGDLYGYNRSPNTKYYVIYSVGTTRGGSASVSDAGVLTETNGASCIYVSNIQEDTQP